MDYEKAYKDLMRDIDIAIKGQRERKTKKVLQKLKVRNMMRQDKRIRKSLLAEIKELSKRLNTNKRIAYLEKQKIFSGKEEGVYGYKDGKIYFLGQWLDNSMYPCDAPVGQDNDGNLVYMEDLEDEKQKEPHYTKRNALFDKCVENCDPAIMKEVSDNVDKMLEKDLKPAEIRDSRQIAFMIENGRRSGVTEGRKQVVDNPEEYGLCKPAEWSEEDSIRYISIGTTLETSVVLSKEEYDANMVWLRELVNAKKYSRPMPTWKPSEEQLNAFQAFVGMIHPDARYNAVLSLLHDLKNHFSHEIH